MNRLEYIVNKLFKENFMVKIQDKVCLEETESTGKTILDVRINSEDNYCIKKADDKSMTEIAFFRPEKQFSMKKRVDHIIFEKKDDDNWNIHLIEMKTTVGEKTWIDAKGKFRASLLLSEAIASMLGMRVQDIKMYTTYEKVDLKQDAYSPTSHRGRTGEKMVRSEDEWNGNDFAINLGERIKFKHIPIKVNRINDVLHGFVKI